MILNLWIYLNLDIPKSAKYFGETNFTDFYIGCGQDSLRDRDFTDRHNVKLYMSNSLRFCMFTTNGKVRFCLPMYERK